MNYIYVFSLVAFVILVIASINYINLATASSLYRAKEVGMRKVMGAGRNQMILQFQIESILITLSASVLALIIAELAIPLFNDIVGKTLPGNLFTQGNVVIGILLIAVLVGSISGIFPIGYILKFNVVQSLKGKVDVLRHSSFNLRNLLVVAQFAISIVLIIGTFVIYKQLVFMQNKNLGIDSEQVLEVFLQTRDVAAQFETFKTRLKNDSRIISVSGADMEFTNRIPGWRQYDLPDNENISLATTIVDPDIFKTLEAEIVAGRDFSSELPTDRTAAYIINESAVSFLNLENPVNTSIDGAIYTGEVWGRKNAKIIGVVKDFNMASLHEEVQPAVFSLQTEGTMPITVLMIRIDGSDVRGVIGKIEEIWNELAPERPFLHEFMDEDIQRHYQAEERFLQVFTIFSTLGILIGCLGLFGLTTFMVKNRIKEIGIRKVLGASVIGLIGLLSWRFMRMVLLANLIAWPVAYLLIEEWLLNFAYRVELTVIVFVLAASLTALVAFLTTAYHSMKSSLANRFWR